MKKDALYYPNINFDDSTLIKGMSVFYDHIYRIVPDGVPIRDNEDITELIEEGKIGKSINPIPYSTQASEEFLLKIDDWSAAALSSTEEEQKEISRLHVDKTDEKVRRIFKEVGLEEKGDWMHIPEILASNYMIYLAKIIASENKLSLITKNWGAWTATNYFSLDGEIDEFITKPDIKNAEENPFSLFNLIINNLTPVNISEVSAKDILKFREKREDEISNFRDCIFGLHDELQNLNAPEVKLDIIKDKIKELQKAQTDYQKAADLIEAKGWRGFAISGFPAATAFADFFGVPAVLGTYIAGASIAFGGAFHIKNTQHELEHLRKENPAALLVDMNRSFENYTQSRGGGDANHHSYNCMEEYIND